MSGTVLAGCRGALSEENSPTLVSPATPSLFHTVCFSLHTKQVIALPFHYLSQKPHFHVRYIFWGQEPNNKGRRIHPHRSRRHSSSASLLYPKYSNMQVHAVQSIPDEDVVITSSSLSPSGPHVLTVWDLPTEEERSSEKQFLPALTYRQETPTRQVWNEASALRVAIMYTI